MRRQLGGLLAIVLGGVLIATGTTSGGATVGAAQTVCGSNVNIGVIPLGCATGRIVVHKVVNGPADEAPADGWDFTIASTNCSIFPGSDATVNVPAAGGTVSSDVLWSTVIVGGDPCEYTITEDAVPGWTTTYNPTGALTLGDAIDVPAGTNDAHVQVNNTFPTTPPPTVTTTTTVPAASPSASPTEALANTGSDHVTPTTIAGIALVVLGGVMLFMGRRRPRRART